MSTVVYQGLESCLASQLMEYRTLKLKLGSPSTVFSVVPADYSSKKLDSPRSRSPPNLCTASETLCENLQAATYVPPFTKHASWWLSDGSLNICTENLGSETGSEFVENSIFSSPASSTSTDNNININKIPLTKEQRQLSSRRVPEPKKQLPPPLTTLSGPECLDIRPQHEDGRLILKAYRNSRPARRSCFLVDRSNGRLRLSLADSRMNVMCSSKEVNQVTVKNDQKVTTNNKEDEYKNEKQLPEKIPSDEKATCSGRSLITEVEHVEPKNTYLLDPQITRVSSCCRCNEDHKNDTNKNTKKKGLTTSMVSLASWWLHPKQASSKTVYNLRNVRQFSLYFGN